MKTTVALIDWDDDTENLAGRVIKAGFGRVVLCITDRHMLYRSESIPDAVDLFKSHGLEVYLDPWGIRGVGGVSITHRTILYDWLQLAAQTDADAIVLAEPIYQMNLSIEEALGAIQAYAPNKPIHLAIEPRNFKPEYREFATEISLSAFFLPLAIERATPSSLESQIDEWYDSLNGNFDSVWVQLFDLPDGKEWLPAALINLWTARNMPINVWAWEAYRNPYTLLPQRPDLVWGHTLSALAIANRL